MADLIPVQYHNARYPEKIKPNIIEVAANFDSKKIKAKTSYSMHTEYSFMGRKFDSEIVSVYEEICNANKKGIPKLWYSEKWSLEFANFVKDIADENIVPTIIEVHPPFSDYTDLDKFMSNYKIFKECVSRYFPDVLVLIENRCGTRYSGGKFIVSKIEQITELSNLIDENKSDLRITLDLPQLFTAHNVTTEKMDLMNELFDKVKIIKHNISGIHLWGKRKSETGRRVSHVGDLNSYFMNDMDFKEAFLKKMYSTFSDGTERYFVPEVNSSSEDLISIVNDLIRIGFEFK